MTAPVPIPVSGRRRLDFALSAAASLALGSAIFVLLWLRHRTAEELTRAPALAAALFQHPEAVLGDPTDPAADFAAAEALTRAALANPYVRRAVLTKLVTGRPPGRDEAPIVPYDLLAVDGPAWTAGLAGMERIPLETRSRVYGYLYLDLDRSPVRNITLAAAGTAAALAAALAALLRRVHAQAGAIDRVRSELDERKRELIRLERLALAGQLSAGLLHDLKKPVLNVRHRIDDALASAPPDAEPLRGELEGARRDLRLFLQMLSDSGMEKFVRSDRVREEYVDLNEVVRAAARLVHYEKGAVELEERLEAGLPSVLAQPFRLTQVFSNLILNAYQAMKGKGRLVLETRAAPGGVEILVTDTGPGVPPEARERIFEPFYTTKGEDEGTGLGLAICRMIVEETGGSLALAPAEEVGARFVVFLKA